MHLFKKDFKIRYNNIIISNKEMKNVRKIIKSLEESGLLIKGIGETIKIEAK